MRSEREGVWRAAARRMGLALTLAIAFAAAQEHRSAVAPVTSAFPNVGESKQAARVLDLTNQERVKNGLSPLKLNSRLCVIARWMAADMAQKRYFDHTDSQGRTVGARAKSFGYAWRAIGENLAAGQESPEDAVADWMRSSGHRRNLLSPEYEEIGIACVVAPGSDFGYYWVQVFAQPRAEQEAKTSGGS